MNNNRLNMNAVMLQGMNSEKKLKRDILDENSLCPPSIVV